MNAFVYKSTLPLMSSSVKIDDSYKNTYEIENGHEDQIKKLMVQISSLSNIKMQETEKFNHFKEILTAIIQAGSSKQKEDSLVIFSLDPIVDKISVKNWMNAMKIIVKLPGGIHPSWRKRIWLAFSNIKLVNVNWKLVMSNCFNFENNQDIQEAVKQIEKDLKRTGFQGVYDGHGANVTLSSLKNVLMAFAKWNKTISYCQGLNILAANILHVCDHCEETALKILIVLVEYVLPSGYFSKDMYCVSVDICTIKELLPKYAPELNKKIEEIRNSEPSNTVETNNDNEPFILNVYLIQWLVSLYSTFFHRELSLRIWDCLLFYGPEILIRVALVIWNNLYKHFINISTPIEFYEKMTFLHIKMNQRNFFDTFDVIKKIIEIAPFPFPGLVDLKDSINFNINALSKKYYPNKETTKDLSNSFWNEKIKSKFKILTSNTTNSLPKNEIVFSQRKKLSESKYLSFLRDNYRKHSKVYKKRAIVMDTLNLETMYPYLIETCDTSVKNESTLKNRSKTQDDSQIHLMNKLQRMNIDKSAIYRKDLNPFT